MIFENMVETLAWYRRVNAFRRSLATAVSVDLEANLTFEKEET